MTTIINYQGRDLLAENDRLRRERDVYIEAAQVEIERLREAMRVARQFLVTECDGGAWDAAETLREALT